MLQFSICVLHFNGSTKFELIFFKLQFSKWSIQEIPSFCSRYTRLVNSIHSNHSLRKEIWTPIYYSFPIYCTFPVCMHISFGNFFDFQLCIEDKKQMSVFSFVQMETTGVIESTHQNKSCGYDKHLMSMLFLCIPIFFGVIHEKFQKSRKNYRFFFLESFEPPWVLKSLCVLGLTKYLSVNSPNKRYERHARRNTSELFTTNLGKRMRIIAKHWTLWCYTTEAAFHPFTTKTALPWTL